MRAYPSRRRTHLTIAARLPRPRPPRSFRSRTGPYGPVPASPVQVIAADGMPGWQITVIALVAATTAVFLDRARAGRRSASAIG